MVMWRYYLFVFLPGLALKNIAKISLDPDGFLPDILPENNSWPLEKQ